MSAFNRIGEKPITIYASVENPDIVVVIDSTLLSTVNVTEGLKKDGILLINSQSSPEEIKRRYGYRDFKIYTVSASRISFEEIGRDMPNTPILGALAKVSGIIELEELRQRFKEHFIEKLGKEIVEKNLRAMERGYKEVMK